jgi:hypothetical protein
MVLAIHAMRPIKLFLGPLEQSKAAFLAVSGPEANAGLCPLVGDQADIVEETQIRKLNAIILG